LENAGINQLVDGTIVVFDPAVNDEGRLLVYESTCGGTT